MCPCPIQPSLTHVCTQLATIYSFPAPISSTLHNNTRIFYISRVETWQNVEKVWLCRLCVLLLCVSFSSDANNGSIPLDELSRIAFPFPCCFIIFHTLPNTTRFSTTNSHLLRSCHDLWRHQSIPMKNVTEESLLSSWVIYCDRASWKTAPICGWVRHLGRKVLALFILFLPPCKTRSSYKFWSQSVATLCSVQLQPFSSHLQQTTPNSCQCNSFLLISLNSISLMTLVLSPLSLWYQPWFDLIFNSFYISLPIYSPHFRQLIDYVIGCRNLLPNATLWLLLHGCLLFGVYVCCMVSHFTFLKLLQPPPPPGPLPPDDPFITCFDTLRETIPSSL